MIEKIINIDALKEWIKLMFWQIRTTFYIPPTLLAIYTQLTGNNFVLTPAIWSILAFISLGIASFIVYQQSFQKYISDSSILNVSVKSCSLALKKGLFDMQTHTVLPTVEIEFMNKIEICNYTQDLLINVNWESIYSNWIPVENSLNMRSLKVQDVTLPNRSALSGNPFKSPASDTVLIQISAIVAFKTINQKSYNYISQISKMEMNLKLTSPKQKIIALPIKYDVKDINQKIEREIVNKIEIARGIQNKLPQTDKPRDIQQEVTELLKYFWMNNSEVLNTHKVINDK